MQHMQRRLVDVERDHDVVLAEPLLMLPDQLNLFEQDAGAQ